MLASLRSDRVADLVDQLGRSGSRALGSPGHAVAVNLLQSQLEGAGFEVVQRRNLVAAPVVERGEIFLQDSQLKDLQLHPFGPNYFQPIATPLEGLRGQLVLIDERSLAEADSYKGKIGVVDLSAVPPDYGLNWARYAQLGLEGILLAAPEGFSMDWSELARSNTMVSALPVNFLRAYVSGPLLDLVGEEVTIYLRQLYQAVENVTLFARLPARQPKREALVLTSAYDSYGILPTLVNER